MATKKRPKKAPKAPAVPAGSAPLDFTEEHVRLAREGKSKEIFELFLAQKTRKKEPQEQSRS